MKGLEMAYAWDIKTRIEDQNLSKVAISTAPTLLTYRALWRSKASECDATSQEILCRTAYRRKRSDVV